MGRRTSRAPASLPHLRGKRWGALKPRGDLLAGVKDARIPGIVTQRRVGGGGFLVGAYLLVLAGLGGKGEGRGLDAKKHNAGGNKKKAVTPSGVSSAARRLGMREDSGMRERNFSGFLTPLCFNIIFSQY